MFLSSASFDGSAVRPILGPTATAEGDKKQEESESGLWEEGRKAKKNCRSCRAGNRAYGREIEGVVVVLSRHCRTHGEKCVF